MYIFPATFLALSRPRAISLRKPATVKPPSGKAILAASCRRKGASPSIFSSALWNDVISQVGTLFCKPPDLGRTKGIATPAHLIDRACSAIEILPTVTSPLIVSKAKDAGTYSEIDSQNSREQTNGAPVRHDAGPRSSVFLHNMAK